MKYALVILEGPAGSDHASLEAWSSATATAQDKTEKSGTVKVLNIGCYLCDLRNGLYEIGLIVATARGYNIQSRTLFFDQEPAFVIQKGKDA
jgi:hypothetical protein